MAIKLIPDGYHSVTPYLVVAEAAKLIDLLKRAFDAEETKRPPAPGGTIGHAEVRVGDCVVMISDARSKAPSMQAMLYPYVQDVDATYRRALDAGAPRSNRRPTGFTATAAPGCRSGRKLLVDRHPYRRAELQRTQPPRRGRDAAGITGLIELAKRRSSRRDRRGGSARCGAIRRRGRSTRPRRSAAHRRGWRPGAPCLRFVLP
jgi:uncharacterized glyoxalase superfamily protein PhnB